MKIPDSRWKITCARSGKRTLSQKQLADLAGITRQAISALESNQYSPPPWSHSNLRERSNVASKICSASNEAGK